VFTFLSWLIAVFLVAVSGLAVGEYVASTTWYRTSALGRTLTRAG
jgi:membrane protein